MAFAVIVYFDPATEADVRTLWDLLAQKNISSAMQDMGVRPHISLAGFKSAPIEPLCSELKAFAQSIHSPTISFGAVGAFPTEQGVIYLAPVVTSELLDVHKAFHARLAQVGIESHEYYQPANWIPHCTVAINLPPEAVGTAVAICRQSDVFHKVQLGEIAFVEYLPVREICRFPLGGIDNVEPR